MDFKSDLHIEMSRGDGQARNGPIFVRELSGTLSQSTVSQNRTGRRRCCSIVVQNELGCRSAHMDSGAFKLNCVQAEFVHTRACLVPFSAAFC